MDISIRQAEPADAGQIARFAKALTDEIIKKTGTRHFNVDQEKTTALCRELMTQGKYRVLLAFEAKSERPIGCATLCESHALYAEGTFGIIQEFYIVPEFRSQQVGATLLERAVIEAGRLGWKRLELCTPPLPGFERTLSFYTDNGFEITGGRKMKRLVT
ncbi:MAG TPA: GNAT family N-acetyltransferase [Geothermobacteraceae bacterium]|nr:GNAT family N-acetyltransferase [Geothermobacteraceae bacterium]